MHRRLLDDFRSGNSDGRNACETFRPSEKHGAKGSTADIPTSASGKTWK
jgi:hypothetical protein